MERLKVKGSISEEELKRRYISCKDSREKIRWQAIWLAKKDGLSGLRVADIVGRTAQTVRKWIKSYNLKGEEGIKSKPNKGMPARLTEDQYNKLEEMLSEPPEYGSRWTGKQIREKIFEEFGESYSLDGVYYILHKRMYRLKSPRPYHPRVNKQEQEIFKKVLQIS